MRLLKINKAKLPFIFILLLLQTTVLAQEIQKNTRYFNQDLVMNPRCADIFISLVKKSDFDFATWANGYGKSVQELKNNVSFMFDSVDETQILAKLFINSDFQEFQGTSTIGWIQYDFNSKTLSDFIQEKELNSSQELANDLESCIKENYYK